MFKIGEFSRLTHVSVRMLRYYDEQGLLKPAQIDKFTGYRLYSVEQVPTLQKIIMLRDLNFGISEIKIVLNNWNDNFITQQFLNKIEESKRIIRLEEQRIDTIKVAIDDIKNKKIDIHYNVIIKSIPSYKVLSLRRTIPNYNCEGMLWDELLKFIKEKHVNIEKHDINNIAFYHDEDHKDTDVDVEVAVIVNKFGRNNASFTYRKTESIDTMASMMVYGAYDNINRAYQDFTYWLDEHQQYEMYGVSRQICHKDNSNEENSDKFLTEIQIPVKIKQLVNFS